MSFRKEYYRTRVCLDLMILNEQWMARQGIVLSRAIGYRLLYQVYVSICYCRQYYMENGVDSIYSTLLRLYPIAIAGII